MQIFFKILITLLVVLFGNVKLPAQSLEKVCKINFDLKGIGLSNLKIVILKFQPDSIENYRIEKTINNAKEKFSYDLRIHEAFRGIIKIIVNQKMVAQSAGCIFAHEKMVVAADKTFLEIKSDQTDFYQSNINTIYLASPFEIKSSESYSYERIKRSYEIFIHEDYSLNAKQNEYERNVVSQVRQFKKYLTTLLGVYDRRKDLSLRTLDTCYNTLKKEFSSTENFLKLERYIAQSKNLFVGKKIPSFSVLD